MVSATAEDFDAIAIHADELEAAIQAFFVRRGRVVGRKGWMVDRVDPLTIPELLTQFLIQLYEEREDDVPPVVYVPAVPDEHEALEVLLADLRRESREGTRGRPIQRVQIRVPQRGDRVNFLSTVQDNAREAFTRNRLKRASDFNARSQALRELQGALELDDSPLRIECYDISHLGGTEVVGSMVVFEDGLSKKSDYRRFKLTQDRNDDFAAMQEVMRRRFFRLLKEQAEPIVDEDGATRKFAYPPNLVVIDGGPGQLNAALDGVREVEASTGQVLEDVAFVSLAKKFEELWRPGHARPVVLPRGSDALYLVQRVRDEAHRFAITYQRQRRTAGIASSELDGVPGIGPTRRKALLQRFGSVKALRKATVDDLAGVPGISRTIAATVLEHLTVGPDDHPSEDDTQ